MDDQNHRALRDLSKTESQDCLRMFLDFAPSKPAANGRDVPDPYYGGAAGFERVLDLCEEASRGLIAHLREKL
jgi:protein-tyrosine phosphatase